MCIRDRSSYNENTKGRSPRLPKLWESILTFVLLIAVMAVGIIVFETDPHVPMFIGVISAAVMALILGYKWEQIEQFMVTGISRAMPSIMILIVIGILIGVWKMCIRDREKIFHGIEFGYYLGLVL